MHGQDLRFQNLSPEDGLSNGRHWAKKCIIRDDFGIVWISTVDGFNRWDGYDVEVFKNDIFDSTSIHSNFVTGISQASDGDLYIGTADKGVARYNYKTGGFTDLGLSKLIEATPQVNHVLCDKEGYVWIGSAFGGVFKYNIEKDSFVSVPLFKNGKKSNWSMGTVNSKILGDGTIVFGGHHGLHFYDEVQDTFRHIDTGNYDVNSMAEASNGKIWVGDHSWQGVMIVDPITGTTELMSLEGDPYGVYGMTTDHEGNIWMGKSNPSQERLIKYDIASKEFEYYNHDPSDEQSFPKAAMVEMVVDSTGHLWYMSSSKGAGYATIENSYFEKILDRPVHNILFKSDSILLLPGESHVHELNLNSKQLSLFYDYGSPLGRRPSFIDSENNLWIMDQTTAAYHIVNVDTKRHRTIPGKIIESFVEQGDLIWTSNVLEYIDKQSLTLYSTNELLKKKGQDTINSSITYEVVTLRDGTVMLATSSDGYYIYNPKDTSLIHESGMDFEEGKISSSSLTYIYESEIGNEIYIATSENLNIWDRDENMFSYVTESEGLYGKILSMIQDTDGHLWVLTSQGMHKVLDGKVVARYDQSYGLQGMVDRVDPTMVRDQKGYIYFSTSNALFRFHPDNFESMLPPRDILIQNLYIKREIQLPQSSEIIRENILFKPKIKIDYGYRDVGFGFVSPFGKARDVEYHYKLLGYDDKWINNGQSRQVHFTNLDDGAYTLQLKGKSSEGMWTNGVSDIEFEILAPWYKRWWAYLLFTGLVFGTIYGIFKYRFRQITKYQDLRTKISSDLHDDVGTLLTSLSMQSDLLGMDAPPEKQHKFEKFGNLSREAMDRMRDTVWAIDSRKDNMVSLVDRMSDYISDMYEDHNVRVIFNHKETKLSASLAPDIRQNVYLIFKEALNNAMKHTNKDTVSISLIQSNKSLFLSVHDNGTINKGKTSGTGISNMKMRAKRIGGELSINTHDGFAVLLQIK